jgi:hypothetical protein
MEISSDAPTVPTELTDPVKAQGPTDTGAARLSPLPHKRLSEILSEIAADTSRSEITIGDLVQHMEGRARAALIFLFAFPNVLPSPPGVSAILGLPLLYLTAQMMLGRIPWLPKVITGRGVSIGVFTSLIERVSPYLARAERMMKPRWSWVVTHRSEKVLGAIALVLAIVITLPIPLGNILPAFSICLIALGVLERDGALATIGVAAATFAVVLSATVIYGMLRAAIFLVFGTLA